MVVILVTVTIGLDGCVALEKGKLLSAPSGANKIAARHNDEGIGAYKLGQAAGAKEHFEAAIAASQTLAEAHYNLGMVLWEAGDEANASTHFMKAANLEPGNEVIASSPALRGVQAPSKSFGGAGAADGHSHSH